MIILMWDPTNEVLYVDLSLHYTCQ